MKFRCPANETMFCSQVFFKSSQQFNLNYFLICLFTSPFSISINIIISILGFHHISAYSEGSNELK